jgi:hypothetical protein
MTEFSTSNIPEPPEPDMIVSMDASADVVTVGDLRKAMEGFADHAQVLVQVCDDDDLPTFFISSVGQLTVLGHPLTPDDPQYSLWIYIR